MSAHLPLTAPDLEQRIVGRRLRVGRIEQQHPTVLGAEAGGELPVLALDVVDDRRTGQVSSDGMTRPALAAPGRREAQHSSGPSLPR